MRLELYNPLQGEHWSVELPSYWVEKIANSHIELNTDESASSNKWTSPWWDELYKYIKQSQVLRPFSELNVSWVPELIYNRSLRGNAIEAAIAAHNVDEETLKNYDDDIIATWLVFIANTKSEFSQWLQALANDLQKSRDTFSRHILVKLINHQLMVGNWLQHQSVYNAKTQCQWWLQWISDNRTVFNKMEKLNIDNLKAHVILASHGEADLIGDNVIIDIKAYANSKTNAKHNWKQLVLYANTLLQQNLRKENCYEKI